MADSPQRIAALPTFRDGALVNGFIAKVVRVVCPEPVHPIKVNVLTHGAQHCIIGAVVRRWRRIFRVVAVAQSHCKAVFAHPVVNDVQVPRVSTEPQVNRLAGLFVLPAVPPFAGSD